MIKPSPYRMINRSSISRRGMEKESMRTLTDPFDIESINLCISIALSRLRKQREKPDFPQPTRKVNSSWIANNGEWDEVESFRCLPAILWRSVEEDNFLFKLDFLLRERVEYTIRIGTWVHDIERPGMRPYRRRIIGTPTPGRVSEPCNRRPFRAVRGALELAAGARQRLDPHPTFGPIPPSYYQKMRFLPNPSLLLQPL